MLQYREDLPRGATRLRNLKAQRLCKYMLKRAYLFDDWLKTNSNSIWLVYGNLSALRLIWMPFAHSAIVADENWFS